MMHYLTAALLAQLPVSVARSVVQKQGIATSTDAKRPRQLLIDISELIKRDARTGIQRVVRGIVQSLFENPPEGYNIRPIFADRHHGYRHAKVCLDCLQLDEVLRKRARTVRPRAGDIYLGLDLAAHLLPRHQGQLLRWKRSGVRVSVIVYDLLPLLYPHWFKPVRQKTFQRWLRTLAIFADDLICISKTVEADLQRMLRDCYGLAATVPQLHTIPLGGDLEATQPSSGCSDEERDLFVQLRNRQFVLMVGTVEPRKGYGDALAAFEQLWLNGQQTALVIVGKPGWKTELIQARIQNNREYNGLLYWFDHASDELLQELYKAAYGVLLASEAEGCGLPLLEAMRYGVPVLARNIPVFIEHATAEVAFFARETTAGQLAEAIRIWLDSLALGEMDTKQYQVPLWSDTAKALLKLLHLKNRQTDVTTHP